MKIKWSPKMKNVGLYERSSNCNSKSPNIFEPTNLDIGSFRDPKIFSTKHFLDKKLFRTKQVLFLLTKFMGQTEFFGPMLFCCQNISGTQRSHWTWTFWILNMLKEGLSLAQLSPSLLFINWELGFMQSVFVLLAIFSIFGNLSTIHNLATYVY